jgi:hypothetical protein
LGSTNAIYIFPDIEALRNLSGVTQIFQGIMETMDKMKLDMANFYIQQFRPSIIRQCIQYERVKFADFLELEYRLHDDGLRFTRNWILRHKIGNRDFTTVIAKACGELLNYNMAFGWPEVRPSPNFYCSIAPLSLVHVSYF